MRTSRSYSLSPYEKVFDYISKIIYILVICFNIAVLLCLLYKGFGSILGVLSSKSEMDSIFRSVLSSTISSLICLVIAIIISIRFKKNNQTSIGKSIILFPMGLPHIISGLGLLLLFSTPTAKMILQVFDIQVVFSVLGIIIAQIFVNLPYSIKMTDIVLGLIDDREIFVARTLGASKLYAIRKLIVPKIWRDLLAIFTMTWARAIGEFGAVMMIAGAMEYRTKIMTTSIYLNLATGDIESATSIALVLISISVVMMMLTNILKGREKRVHDHTHNEGDNDVGY